MFFRWDISKHILGLYRWERFVYRIFIWNIYIYILCISIFGMCKDICMYVYVYVHRGLYLFRPPKMLMYPHGIFWPPDLNQGTSTKALIPSASMVPVSSNWVILLSSRMSSILNSTRTKKRCSSSPGNSGSGMVLGRSWNRSTGWRMDVG